MGSSPKGVLVLLGVALLLSVGCSGSFSSSSPHSLRYFYMGVSEPGQGLPLFVQVGYVDDQPITRYDSNTRRKVPVAPWMKKVGNEDPQYWESSTQVLQETESAFRVDLGRLRERFNQQNSTGLHTLQWMYGCEVGPDVRLRGGHYQIAYDGEDFLAFDIETVSWTAAITQAKISKQKLDMRLDTSQSKKDYLEGTCVEWLRRYLDYGKEALLRTEWPTVRVAHKKGYDGQETLFCQLYGFYPKEIEVTWMKDGEDQKPHTWTGGVVPNSDGTYNTWLSIEVDPKEKDHYRCRVGHDSLLEPLDLAWEEPASNSGLILGIVGALLAALILVGAAGAVFYLRKHLKSYEAASRKHLKSIKAASTSASDLGLIPGILYVVLAVALLGVGIVLLREWKEKGHEAASTSASDLGLILGILAVVLDVALLGVGIVLLRKHLKSIKAASRERKEKGHEAASRKRKEKGHEAASSFQLTNPRSDASERLSVLTHAWISKGERKEKGHEAASRCSSRSSSETSDGCRDPGSDCTRALV